MNLIDGLIPKDLIVGLRLTGSTDDLILKDLIDDLMMKDRIDDLIRMARIVPSKWMDLPDGLIPMDLIGDSRPKFPLMALWMVG